MWASCMDLVTPAICFHAFTFAQCVAWLGSTHGFFLSFFDAFPCFSWGTKVYKIVKSVWFQMVIDAWVW